MGNYLEMSRDALLAEKEALHKTYDHYKDMGLSLNMARGLPCTEQLELSMGMYHVGENYITEDGSDARNYGVLEGLPEARHFFGELLDCKSSEVFVGGSSSLQLMYMAIDFCYVFGNCDSPRPWRMEEKLKFLCPVPGYDRHFRITEEFGFELIPIPMDENGPDMDLVEKLVAEDESIKGMWCVPQYSNPDGVVYSNEVIHRIASMKTAAKDFRVMWDQAYFLHHLTDEVITNDNMLEACKAAGNPNRVYIFCSTSKITFPGAGVSVIACSEENIKSLCKHMSPMIISFDKMSQRRHVRYLQDKAHVLKHMKRHRAIIGPKFEITKETFAREFNSCGPIARWTNPKGGYFIGLYLLPGCAKRTAQLCKEAGLTLTGAGACYPYGNDPADAHLRIAPTYPSIEDIKIASYLLTVCARLATVEKLLQK